MSAWVPRVRIAALVVATLLVPSAAIAIPIEPDPIKVLVFSRPYGFSHTPSIAAGGTFLDGLDGAEFFVDNTTDHTKLAPANLANYDVLVWNNSTGEVPADVDKKALVQWVRDGHGFVGIHSAADSNYTWPELAEIVGGHYHGHWYRFGGITPEPTRMKLVKEDPTNPLMAGVPADYESYDETYKWQVDVRPDVHVLMSMDNTSIAQGAAYDWHQPLTWCRPVGEGRSFYTNLGHDAALWSDTVFQTMVLNAIRFGGGRLDADCSVPTDPATGVSGAERIGAVWADQIVGASSQVSTYGGGSAVLTRIQPGTASITWEDVDLTDVTSIDVFATAQTIAPPATAQIVGIPTQLRITPATGGTVEIHRGSAAGPLLGTVTIPPAPGLLSTTTLPSELDPVLQTTGPVASWAKLTATVPRQSGEADLVLTFPSGPLNTAVQALAPERNFIGSVGWIRLGR